MVHPYNGTFAQRYIRTMVHSDEEGLTGRRPGKEST